jgi:hypothetical protein
MENNFNYTQPAPSPAPAIAGAAVVQKSRATAVIILICALLAGMITSSLVYFLGNSATTYERAERSAMNSVFNSVSPWLSLDAKAAESGSITITPAWRELSNIPNLGIPDLSELGSFTFHYEAIIDGTDMYALLGAEMLGIEAQMAYWLLGNEMIMHFPGISEYYIVIEDIMEMYMDMYMYGAMSGFNFDIDYDAMWNEIQVIANAVLDRYFELTANTEPAWSEMVNVGDLSREANVFEVVMDERFLFELAKTGFEAFLDSKILFEFVRDLYDLENDRYRDRSWYQSFDDVLDEIRYELKDMHPDDLDDGEIITMRTFISGRDVVRRDIIIDDVRFTYSSITERDGRYARSARFSSTNWRGDTTTITYSNDGATDKNYSTGRIRFSVSEPYSDTVTVTLNYDNFRFYDNGLFGGDVSISVPVDGTTYGVSLNSVVNGNTQDISLWVFGAVYGAEFRVKLADIEIKINTSPNNSITRPRLTDNNTIDPNDWRAMQNLEDDFYDWAMGLNVDFDFIEGLLWDSGLYYLLGGGFGGYSYPEGDYCYECWSYHDWWDPCAVSDNWCDSCWGYHDWWDDCPSFSSSGNYCDNCWEYHDWWDDCYSHGWCNFPNECWCADCYKPCPECDGYHWGADADYIAYVHNYNKGIFKIMLGGNWSEPLWNMITADMGDCIAYNWNGWLEAYDSYGFDLYSLYYETMDAIYSADWSAYIDGVQWDWDTFTWSEAQWESFFRNLLRDANFAF